MAFNQTKAWMNMSAAQKARWFIEHKCVQVENECIVYTGKSSKESGHVQLNFGGERWMIHRFAYSALIGPIPDGMDVCHRCDNPKCVNVTHLWLGTRADNNRDMHAKGRSNYSLARKTHCIHGHEFTPENTVYHGKDNFRRCRECNRMRQRRDYVPREKPPLTAAQLRQQRYRVRRKARLATQAAPL